MRRAGAVLAILLVLSAAQGSAQQEPATSARLVSDDLEHPVALLFDPAQKGVLYVVERDGTVPEMRNGKLTGDELLDISETVQHTQRHRLMAVALHPDFSSNHLFYAYFNDVQGDAVVAQFTANTEETPDIDALTAVVKFAQPVLTQNGGWLGFGPDKQLYISTASSNERGAASSPASLLGKIVRITPLTKGGYEVPLDNPGNTQQQGLSREVWASGFISPEHFSFGDNGKLFVLDSRGDNAQARVSLVSAGGTPAGSPSYTAARGEQLVGGAVCRSCGLPSAEGSYLLADVASGRIFSLHEEAGQLVRREIAQLPKSKLTAITLSNDGKILAATEKGEIFEIAKGSSSTSAKQ